MITDSAQATPPPVPARSAGTGVKITNQAGDAYSGASAMRRVVRGWMATGADADSIVRSDLNSLRDRSFDAVRNIPIATSIVKTPVTNVVGSGLVMQSRIAREVLGLSDTEAEAWQANTEHEFRIWSESVECDAARKLVFGEQQSLAFYSALMAGDSFALLPMIKRSNNPYCLAVKLIEAHQVSTPPAYMHDHNVVEGIRNNQHNEPTTYYFADRHPGSTWTGQRKWKAVPARGKRSGRINVIHLFTPERIGQSRGIPYLAPVLEQLKQLVRLTDAELMAAVITSMLTVFVKKNAGSDGLQDSFENDGQPEVAKAPTELKLGNGLVIDLEEGEDITTVDPTRPNSAFDPFFDAIVKQIGAAVEQPADIILKQFNKSYSASRAAFLQAWQFYKTRRVWLARHFCQPIYVEWLREAVIIGRIKAPGFLEDPAMRYAWAGAEWQGPAPGQLDPLKEVIAAVKRVDADFSTRSKETTELTGGDFDINVQQRTREEKKRRAGGLVPVETQGTTK
ncbi:MAG: phage portal protein [Proteobacteria bacterium]|nr:phage portal protein [Pseudomonadota bacterium]